MGEGLGEIPESLAVAPCFFCIETKVVGVPQHLFEHQASFVQSSPVISSGPREGLDKPKRTNVECPFLSGQPVGTPHILRQHGVSFDALHRQSWIAKMKADELVGAIDLHNINFKNDQRFRSPDDVNIASLDISSLVDAGRFQEVPAQQALMELERLRRRTPQK